MTLFPVTQREASAFIRKHHRHHLPSRGWKFGIGVLDGDRLCGVVTVGRPVSRELDRLRIVAEVNRCCTDGTRHAASKLYAAAWRAARAMGYRRLITYTLASEPGASLRAAGYRVIGEVDGRSWNCPSRPREDHSPTGDKRVWEIVG